MVHELDRTCRTMMLDAFGPNPSIVYNFRSCIVLRLAVVLVAERASKFVGPYDRNADVSGADKYYPHDLKKRVDINRWLLWEAAHWQPSCYVFFIENAVKPVIKVPTDKALLEKETPNWRRLAPKFSSNTRLNPLRQKSTAFPEPCVSASTMKRSTASPVRARFAREIW